ncbi:MAG: phosphatidate cytidylyltransferase [Oscillospiraceae bacterium]|nr:phosphatidate cytidylyltransferase [Oscillospiraceae bacterium]
MQEFLHGASRIGLYIAAVVSIMFTARGFLKIPDELFRKILHFILLGLYIPFLFAFETWWISAGLAAVIVVLLYPVFIFAGRIPNFSTFVNERKQGEFRHSMVLALGMMAVSISICWGWLGDRYLVLASIYAWGVGDGFAALIGKPFGKHKIRMRFADPHKSVEGSAAMFLTSTVAVLAVLLIRGGLGFGSCLLISVTSAAVSTLVELCSRNGYDTVTCPAAAMTIILPLVNLLGG